VNRLRLAAHGLAFALYALAGRHYYVSTYCVHALLGDEFRHAECRQACKMNGAYGDEHCRCHHHKGERR
jgi:hypothetical protein